MTKTRVSVVEEADTDAEIQAQAEELAKLNQASGGDLFNVTDELRAAGISGVVCLVTRNTPIERKGYCGTLSISEFNLEKMRVSFGAGRYMVQIKGPKGFLPGGGPVEIAEMPEQPKHGGGDFQSFLESQARRDAERSSKLWELAMISVPALIAGFFNRPQGNDVAALVTALKPAPGPTLGDLSTAMVNMRTLTAPEKQDSKIDEILKVFEAAQNLMGEKGESNSNGGSSWIDIIRDLIKIAPDAIKPMLEARMAAMQAAATARPSVQAAPATSHAAIAAKPTATNAATPPTMNATEKLSAAAATNGENDMRALWEPIAKQHLAKVFAWAEKDRSPDVYAEVFVDELPNLSAYLTIDQVLEHLQNPAWFAKVCELEPRLINHKDYCTEMHDGIVEIVKDMKLQAEEETPTPEPEKINDPSTE